MKEVITGDVVMVDSLFGDVDVDDGRELSGILMKHIGKRVKITIEIEEDSAYCF